MQEQILTGNIISPTFPPIILINFFTEFCDFAVQIKH